MEEQKQLQMNINTTEKMMTIINTELKQQQPHYPSGGP
jgi:hypothetical protein